MSVKKGLLLHFFMDFFLKYWKKELVVIVLILMDSGFMLLVPYLNKILIDDVLLQGKFDLFYSVLGGMVGASLLQVLLSTVKDYLYFNIGENVLKDIRLRIVNHVLKLSQSFFGRIQVGQLLSRIETDVMVLQQISSSVFIELFANIINLLFLAGIMVYFNWKLTIISGIIVIIYMFSHNYFSTRTKDRSKENLGAVSNVMGNLAEMFTNIMTVKLFNREDWAFNRILDLYKDLYQKSFRLKVLQAVSINFTFGLSVTGIGILWLMGGNAIQEGTMTLGTVIAFSTYQSRMFSPLRMFSSLNNQIQNALASLERIYEILREDADIKNLPGALSMQNPSGEIEFKNVSFSYNGLNKVIKDLSFKIKEGEVVAFMGPSGCGKSTVFKLLTRMYDPQEGEILIDGRNIRYYTLESLRGHMSIILQEIELFKMSVYDNLIFGNMGVPMKKITDMVEKVDMTEFIESLPEGYQTILEEKGNNLSGGQKKRLGIARSFIKDSKIIIIDEASNSLDNERRDRVKAIIDELRGKCTILLISHHLSEVKDADRILVMQDGEIVAIGDHSYLLRENDTYKKQYEKENTGYCGETA